MQRAAIKTTSKFQIEKLTKKCKNVFPEKLKDSPYLKYIERFKELNLNSNSLPSIQNKI